MRKPLITELCPSATPTRHFPAAAAGTADSARHVPDALRRDGPPPLRALDEATLRSHFADLAALPQPPWPGAAAAARAAELPGLSAAHPAQPAPTMQGVLEVIHDVARALAAITGLERFCLQPSSPAAAERAALMVAARFFARTQPGRTEVVAPADSSALARADELGLASRSIARLPSGELDVDELDAALGPATALVVASWLTPVGGFERNLAAAGQLAHARGALFGVDATGLARLAGHTRLREAEADIAWLGLAELCPPALGAALGVRSHLTECLPGPLVAKERSGYELDDDLSNTIGPLALAPARLPDALALYVALRTLGEAGLRERAERMGERGLARDR